MPNQFLNPNDQQSVNNYVDLRTALVLTSITEVNNLDAGTAPAIIYEGKVYARDPNDTTSVADNVNVIEDRNGTRFKAFLDRVPRSVITNLVAPPTNNNLGDAYLVFGSGAPSGAFANQRENIAIWTPWEWRFIAPPIGTRIFNQGDQQNYYFDGSIWRNDIISLQDNVVDPNALSFRNTIIQRVTNNPPGQIPNDELFIIGQNPTGAWVANPNDIAFGRGSEWKFITPRQGEVVYNLRDATIMIWRNGAWEVFQEDTVIENRLLFLGSRNFARQVYGTRAGWSLYLSKPVQSVRDIAIWELTGVVRSNPRFTCTVERFSSSAGEATQEIDFVLGMWSENATGINPNVRTLARSGMVTANRERQGSNYRWSFSGEVEFKRSPADLEQIKLSDFHLVNTVPIGERIRIGIIADQAGYNATGNISNVNFGMLFKLEKQV